MSDILFTYDLKAGSVDLRGRGVGANFPSNGYLVASADAYGNDLVKITAPGSVDLLIRIPRLSIKDGITGLKLGADVAATVTNLNDNYLNAGVHPDLDDLNDVNLGIANVNDVLTWNGSVWSSEAIPDIASTDLTDTANLIRTTNSISDLNFLAAPSLTGDVPYFIAGVGWIASQVLGAVNFVDADGTGGLVCSLSGSNATVDFKSTDGSVAFTMDNTAKSVDFSVEKPRYTFHDAGRRQWSSIQDNYYHIGDSVYGMYDNAENFASSIIQPSNTFDFYMMNGWPMPAAVTNIKMNGFIAPLSTGFLSQDLQVSLYRFRHTTGTDDSVSQLLHTETVTTGAIAGYATALDFSFTTADINEQDVLMVTYRYPNAVLSATSYMNYTTTVTAW